MTTPIMTYFTIAHFCVALATCVILTTFAGLDLLETDPLSPPPPNNVSTLVRAVRCVCNRVKNSSNPEFRFGTLDSVIST